MKQLLTFALCLSLFMAACAGESSSQPPVPPAPEPASGMSSLEESVGEREAERTPDAMEMGLTIDGTYYPIPSALRQYLDDGWSVSGQTPYFLQPMASEDYYETRANLSLTEDGGGILPGGSIIRLLEKDGVFLEVTIANQTDPIKGGPVIKIEDGVVDSITVFYDEAHTSIKLGGTELRSLTPEALLAAFPGDDGWTHAPSDYSNHPELGISIDYELDNNLDYCNRTISIYFDPEYTPFKITVHNQTPLGLYSK